MGICPFMSNAEKLVECKGYECALWRPGNEACSIWVLAGISLGINKNRV